MFGRFCQWKNKYISVRAQFWIFSTQRHFPNVLWEQKALSLPVYRWLAKNKWEVQAWLNRAAAEDSYKWFPALSFHKLCFGGCRNETRCRVMLSITSGVRKKSCLISILHTSSLEAYSLSVITAESFLGSSHDLMGFDELFGAERTRSFGACVNKEMKTIPCTWMPCALGCVHPKMHTPSPLVSPALILNLHGFSGAKTGFPNFQGSPVYLL